MRRKALVLIAGATALCSPSASADVTFGLSIAVAHEDGAAVVDDAWLENGIREANRIFSRDGVTFRWTLQKELPDTAREIHSRGGRHALELLGEPSTIDVFVVSRLEDVDEPGRYRMGVCWTGQGPDKRRYIILAKHAHATVLAHELGHFFGNPHSEVVDNLMSYERTGAEVFLDEVQSHRIRRFASSFLARGRLVDVGPPLRFLW